MNIQHTENHQQGAFVIFSPDDRKLAELTYYFIDDNTINANHTYVSEALRGQGIADKLYQALRQFVRVKNLKLVASCSYIAKKLERDKTK